MSSHSSLFSDPKSVPPPPPLPPPPPSLLHLNSPPKQPDNQDRRVDRSQNDDDDDNWGRFDPIDPFKNYGNTTTTTTTTIKKKATSDVAFLGVCLKSMLGLAVTLYVLNQKHALPLNLSRVVSKVLFWPTLPLTVVKRLGRGRRSWMTPIDSTVVMGGAPFGFANIPEYLKEHYNVRGIINVCEEYSGPIHRYRALGMTQLYLPTPDHFEPSVNDMERAVDFIRLCQSKGQAVYVHCRAGHGRSAAIVMAYLLSLSPSSLDHPFIEDEDDTTTTAQRQRINAHLCRLRHVRKTLWKQPNIKRYHAKLVSQHRSNSEAVETNDLELMEHEIVPFTEEQ